MRLLSEAANASCNSVIWESMFTCYIPRCSQNKPAGSTVAFLYFISLGRLRGRPPLTLGGAVSARFICLINIPRVYFNSPLKMELKLIRTLRPPSLALECPSPLACPYPRGLVGTARLGHLLLVVQENGAGWQARVPRVPGPGDGPPQPSLPPRHSRVLLSCFCVKQQVPSRFRSDLGFLAQGLSPVSSGQPVP